MASHVMPASEVAVREEVIEQIQAAQDRGDDTFFLTHNYIIRALPVQIRNLKATLQILHLDNNYELAALPPQIGDLSNLRWLNVSYNKLSALPL
jgi:hypothetical protein